MLHVWFIAIVAVLFLRDAIGDPAGVVFLPDRLQSVAGFASPLLFLPIWIGVYAGARACLARFDRGRPRAIVVSYGVVDAGQALAVVGHAVAVLVFGWLDAVRSVVGNVVLIDELIAILPVLLTIAWCWSCSYNIDRRCREALMLRHLDTAQPVVLPSRRQFVIAQARHHAALVLIPILLISAWSELGGLVLRWLATGIDDPGRLGGLARAVAAPHRLDLSAGVLQLIGVALVFTFTPLLLRALWDTAPLADGPLRARLQRVCNASGVRIRDLLVWRTHVSMINGAVVGLLAPLRYILLTDALLDSLDTDQVEAVMAHEVGHVRHRHMPWLAGILIVSVTGVSAGLAIAIGSVPIGWLGVAELLITVAGFGTGLLLLGLVSRRFEWQADAFAVQALARSRARGIGRPIIRTEEVNAMSGALASVARLNHIPDSRPSWRHGSIAQRRTRLRSLDGLDADRLPIDRTVRLIKLAAILAAAALSIGGLALW